MSASSALTSVLRTALTRTAHTVAAAPPDIGSMQTPYLAMVRMSK